MATAVGATGTLASQQLPPLAAVFAQVDATNQDGEPLTRGPIHEAYAKVVSFNPEPGIVVHKQVPDPIEEVPPADRPANEDAIWIPGYWGWDDDRQDFIWISGVWRVPPPGREWVPGYWTQADSGSQWISGCWRPFEDLAQRQVDVQYLPNPPKSLEAGPASSQPSENHFWSPGTWMWQDVRYVWRPGSWVVSRSDWVWIPAHYLWTPSGCVFIEGHWDYVFERRGMVFAPVYFPRPAVLRPAFRYTPAVVVNVNVIGTSLFCRPRYDHYYFGDFYEPRYQQIGIVPWFELYRSRVAYEPFYVYDRWHYGRQEPDWSRRVQQSYEYRVHHEQARPPRSYASMERLLDRPEARQEGRVLVVPLQRVAQTPDFPVRLQHVDDQYRQRMVAMGQQFRDFSRERSQREQDARQRATAEHPQRPQTLALPPTPFRQQQVRVSERPGQPQPSPRPPAERKPEPERRPPGASQPQPRAPSHPEGERRGPEPPRAEPRTPSQPQPRTTFRPEGGGRGPESRRDESRSPQPQFERREPSRPEGGGRGPERSRKESRGERD